MDPINWKRVVGQKVARMTPEEALAMIKAVNARNKLVRGATIFHPELKELTGGFNSQNINFYCMRKLGIRAGLIQGDA